MGCSKLLVRRTVYHVFRKGQRTMNFGLLIISSSSIIKIIVVRIVYVLKYILKVNYHQIEYTNIPPNRQPVNLAVCYSFSLTNSSIVKIRFEKEQCKVNYKLYSGAGFITYYWKKTGKELKTKKLFCYSFDNMWENINCCDNHWSQPFVSCILLKFDPM